VSENHWQAIEAFRSPHEYWRFTQWLALQVARGYAKPIPANNSDGRLPVWEEKHYLCDDGLVWVLSAPDFPFRGSWQPLTLQLNTQRFEVIEAFRSIHEYKRFTHWLNLQVEQGHALELVGVSSEGNKHYQCDDGKVWVLSSIDFSFRGFWRPLTKALNKSRWQMIEGFDSADDYQQFEQWLNLQVKKGYATLMLNNNDWEKHYQCDDGKEWVLCAPDFPFRGSWQPL